MATFNGQDRFTLSNVAAGTYPVTLRGGTYWIEFAGTGAGTVDLKKLAPDGVTYTARITQIVATAGQQTIALAPGQYEVVIAGFTANNIEISRIPTAIE